MSRGPFHLSELDGVGSGMGSADLLATARELERLDGGAIRPSDGFTDRVLAAIGAEPLPRPMAVAGVAARQGRLGTMLAALRDTWHVAWSGGRPLAVRAQAMAFVLLLIVAVGSVSGLATAGAINALFPPSSPPPLQPNPTNPLRQEATPSPEPTETPPPAAPIAAPTPTERLEPTGTPEPDRTPEPQKTPGHTERPGHTETPEPADTPEASDDSGHGGHGGDGGGGGGKP
jgi:hypothetical protein